MQAEAQKDWVKRLADVGRARSQAAQPSTEEDPKPSVLIAFRGWSDGRVELITPTPMHPADAVRVALHAIAKWSQEQEVTP